MEVHALDERMDLCAVDGEQKREPLGHGVDVGEVPALELDEPFERDVGLDDRGEDLAQAEIALVRVGDARPDLRHDVRREAAALGERGEQRLEVCPVLVCIDEQEDLLLGGDVFVQVRPRPAEFVGDGGEGDLVIGARLELVHRSRLDLGYALRLLLVAPRSDESGHVVSNVRSRQHYTIGDG